MLDGGTSATVPFQKIVYALTPSFLSTFFFNSPFFHVFFFMFSTCRWAAWSGCVLASATSSSGYSLRSRWITCVRISWLLTPPVMKSGRAMPLASCWSSSCCWEITWMQVLEMPSHMALTWVLSVRWVFNFKHGIKSPFVGALYLFCMYFIVFFFG